MSGTPLSVLVVGAETALGGAVLRELDTDPSYLAIPLWIREKDFRDPKFLEESITSRGFSLHAIINCSLKLDSKVSWTDLYLHNVMPACVMVDCARHGNAYYVQAGTVVSDSPAAISAWMADQHIHAPRVTSWREPVFTVRLGARISIRAAATALIQCCREQNSGIYYAGNDGALLPTQPLESAHV